MTKSLSPFLRVLARVEKRNRARGKVLTVDAVLAQTLQERCGGRVPRLFGRSGPKDVRTEDLLVPSRGGALPVRIYHAAGADKARPGLVFVHGGGFVMGHPDGIDHICRRLAKDGELTVVSVDYRLAPEHPYPAAVEDCVDALAWVREQGAAIGVDPTRLAVAGDSAGGNLGAALALWDRDHGSSAPLLAQALIYPALSARMDDPFMLAYVGPGLQLQDCRGLVAAYVGDHPDRIEEPYCSPLLAPTLAGLPPTLVVTGEVDILRDHGRLYVERLHADGVDARWSNYLRSPHAFVSLDRVCREAQPALREIVAFLRTHLHVTARQGAGR